MTAIGSTAARPPVSTASSVTSPPSTMVTGPGLRHVRRRGRRDLVGAGPQAQRVRAVASVRAVRPPGIAVTVAPAIGRPSLASVTVPWSEAARHELDAVGRVGCQDRLVEPELQGVGPGGVLDADERVAPVTGVGRRRRRRAGRSRRSPTA